MNSVLFLYEISLGPHLSDFISNYSVIPAKYFHLAVVDKWNLVDRFLPLFTSIFLHGGWFHLIGNMIYLWVFGDNMEDMMGHTKYLIFYLLCGLGASYAHLYTNVSSPMPTIGASGAIAGVMGAYFVLFPRSKVWTLFPIFFFIQIVQIPAFALLGFWFLMQFFMGFFSLGMSSPTTKRLMESSLGGWSGMVGAYRGLCMWGFISFRFQKENLCALCSLTAFTVSLWRR